MQEIPQFGPQLSQSYAHIVDLISKPGTDCDMMFSLGRRWEALKQNATISALKEMLRKYTCDGLECGTCYECEKQHTKYAEEERNQIKFDYVTDVPLEPMPEPNPLEAKQRADIARALADLNRPGGRRW